jgi:hypothetical protein
MAHLSTQTVDVPHPARRSPLLYAPGREGAGEFAPSCGTRAFPCSASGGHVAFGRLLPLAMAMNGVSGPELAKKHISKHRANSDPGAIHTVLVACKSLRESG